MDSSNLEHSDSDSGDSWTLIENQSTYGDDAPDTPDHPTESHTPENPEKDEDTDGISIITDSEPESSSPCQISYEHYLSEENTTTEHHVPQFIPMNSDLHDINNHESSREEHDFLEESGGKHKTYVHRRNKRLSTVLNIIMLGSVITAAGIAIGHMWGAKTDCSMNTPTSINKILSNLYKLQEENAYLWSKLKELRALNNYQLNQQKATLKQNKCKKVFEEPLINNDSKKVTKCVDDKLVSYDKLITSHMAEAAKKENSDEFLNETEDLTKIRKNYGEPLKYFEKLKALNVKENKVNKQENKYLKENNNYPKRQYVSEIDSLTHDINTNNDNYFENNSKDNEKIGNEVNLSSKGKNTNTNSDQLKEGSPNLLNEFINEEIRQTANKKENNRLFKREEHPKYLKDKIRKKDNKSVIYKGQRRRNSDEEIIYHNDNIETLNDKNFKKNKLQEKNKTSKVKDFDENLMSEFTNIPTDKVHKKDNKKTIKAESKDFEKNKISKDEYNTEKGDKKLNSGNNYQSYSSDEDFKKDNRYVGQKQKNERMKYDRKQLHKKNKKRNKYEQWNMKGELFKGYDEISETSFQGKKNLVNKPNLMNDKIYIRHFEDNIVDSVIDTIADSLNHDPKNVKVNKGKEDGLTWLEKRARFRTESRQKLQEELFDDVNAAGWYFRRMRKREQDREKGGNTTQRKQLKRNYYDF